MYLYICVTKIPAVHLYMCCGFFFSSALLLLIHSSSRHKFYLWHLKQSCDIFLYLCYNKLCNVSLYLLRFIPLYIVIQLLTIEALYMIWYRPESTNIDRGGAEVNIGILRSISYHVQCHNSQQLFYYIITLNKNKQQQQQNLGYGLCLGQSWISFFPWWLTDFSQLKEGWMHTLFVITTADREDPD